MIVRDVATRIPRFVVLILGVAVLRHLYEFFATVGTPTHIVAYHWALLAAAELAMAAVAVHRPRMFQVRTFRLPGVAVTALTAMLLIPLPPVVSLYRDLIHPHMVLGLAAGIATMAFVFSFGRQAPTVRGNDEPTKTGTLTVWGIVGLALVLLPIWIATIGSLPIAQLITGAATGVDVAAARSEALKEISSVPLRLAIGAIRNLYLFLAVGWLVAHWRLSNRQARTRFWNGVAAFGTMGLAAFYALVTTERALLGHLIVIVTVVLIVSVGGTLRAGTMSTAITGALAFPFLFGLLNLGAEFGKAFGAIGRRMFFVPADVMTLHFVAFPQRVDYLKGASIPKVARLWGGETFDLSGFIFDSFFRRSSAFAGNANSSFLAVGWANGGVIGVVIWAGLTAATLVWLDRLLDRTPIRWSAAIRGLAVVQALLLTSSDIFRSLLGVGPGFLDLVLLTLVVLFFHERSLVTGTRGSARRPRIFHRNGLLAEPERAR